MVCNTPHAFTRRTEEIHRNSQASEMLILSVHRQVFYKHSYQKHLLTCPNKLNITFTNLLVTYLQL